MPNPERWTVDGAEVVCDADILFERIHATDAQLRLAAAAPRLLSALRAITENCVLVRKHWGENDNTREASAAESEAFAVLKELDQ